MHAQREGGEAGGAGVQHGVSRALLLPQEHPALPAVDFLLFSMCLCGWCCQTPSSGREGSMTMDGVEVRRRSSPKPRELEN